jgi:hypothetical protein
MSTETETIDSHDPQPETVPITTQSLRVLLELAQQARRRPGSWLRWSA